MLGLGKTLGSCLRILGSSNSATLLLFLLLLNPIKWRHPLAVPRALDTPRVQQPETDRFVGEMRVDGKFREGWTHYPLKSQKRYCIVKYTINNFCYVVISTVFLVIILHFQIILMYSVDYSWIIDLTQHWVIQENVFFFLSGINPHPIPYFESTFFLVISLLTWIFFLSRCRKPAQFRR